MLKDGRLDAMEICPIVVVVDAGLTKDAKDSSGFRLLELLQTF